MIDGQEKRWWRYRAQTYDDGSLYIVAERYAVTRRTAKGVWLSVDGKDKFVLDVAYRLCGVPNKRWAYARAQDALTDYRIRTKRHRELMEWRLKSVERVIDALSNDRYVLAAVGDGDYHVADGRDEEFGASFI